MTVKSKTEYQKNNIGGSQTAYSIASQIPRAFEANNAETKAYTVVIGGQAAQVRNAAELVTVLDALNGSEDCAVLEQLKDNLHVIISDSKGLYQVLKALDTENHIYLLSILASIQVPTTGNNQPPPSTAYHDLSQVSAASYVPQPNCWLSVPSSPSALSAPSSLSEPLAVRRTQLDIQHTKSGLGSLFTDAKGLCELLAFMSQPGTEAFLLAGIGAGHLREIIQCPSELADVLEWIYGEDDLLLMNLIGMEHIALLFRTGTEISLVLHNLDAKGQQKLLEVIGYENIPEMVHTWQDLAYIMRSLPRELSLSLLEKFTPSKLRRLFSNDCDRASISRFLENQEEAALDKILRH